MNSKQRKTGISAALASALFLGAVPIFGKQAILFGFAPLAVVALRTTIAAALLTILMLIFRRQFFYIFPVGLIGCTVAGVVNGLGSILYYTSLQTLDAGVGQLLYAFYPIFVAFWLMLDRQPISRLTIFRMVLSVPGIYLLIRAGRDGVNLLGAGMMLGSAILYALHLIINQRVLYEVPAPTVTLYTLYAMAATVVIAYLIFNRTLPPPSTPWWPIVGMGVLTFAARLTLFTGVKHVGGLQTAMLGFLELMITVSLAHVWLHETLTPSQWIGTGLLAASLILVGFDKFTPEKRRTTGLLAWLNPPGIPTFKLPWQ